MVANAAKCKLWAWKRREVILNTFFEDTSKCWIIERILHYKWSDTFIDGRRSKWSNKRREKLTCSAITRVKYKTPHEIGTQIMNYKPSVQVVTMVVKSRFNSEFL